MLSFPLCNVHCDIIYELPPRYSHYGAVSCFSCRAFFRRSVEKGSVYICQKENIKHLQGECEITKSTRKKCQFCRFAKCKMVGMKHEKLSSIVSSNSN